MTLVWDHTRSTHRPGESSARCKRAERAHGFEGNHLKSSSLMALLRVLLFISLFSLYDERLCKIELITAAKGPPRLSRRPHPFDRDPLRSRGIRCYTLLPGRLFLLRLKTFAVEPVTRTFAISNRVIFPDGPRDQVIWQKVQRCLRPTIASSGRPPEKVRSKSCDRAVLPRLMAVRQL